MVKPSITPRETRGVSVRSAEPADAAFIASLVRELAAYEKLSHAVEAQPSDLAEALFGPAPRVFCEVAEWQGERAGFALWFYNFSTFRGRHGIYLEDLYVRQAHRSHGLGRALLHRLAQRCVTEKLARIEWAVLDWNAPAIAFYRAQGAVLLDDWTTCRLSGDALASLGSDP